MLSCRLHSKLYKMAQDNIRSVVYRTLKKSLYVPYEGYEGSDEIYKHGTSRKSKTSSTMVEPIIKRGIIPKRPKQNSIFKKEKKAAISKGSSELHNDPSLQVLQVSKEAQKLNQMIDSWSKGPSFDGHSRDIAGDLLKGALDLQESLIMLGKLQEASRIMAMLKKKQKSKFMEDEEVDFEEMGLKRFANHSYHKRVQAPRVSVDGSSRNYVEELREVIKDSLARQNLLSTHSDEETGSWGGRQFDSPSSVPSSLSRSSTVPSNSGFKNFSFEQKTAKESCVSLTEQQKVAKKPSLIAKLMGLEEIPSETVQSTRKEEDGKKLLFQRRPVFDIDMRKVRKMQVVEKSKDPERKTLKEIIDTMQFKGLLKSDHAEDHKQQSHFQGTPRLKSKSFYTETQRSGDELPPIVIIKPLHFPREKAESIQEERIEEPKQKITTSAAKELNTLEGTDESSHKTKSTVSSGKKQKKIEASKPYKKPEKMQETIVNGTKFVDKENVKSAKVSRTRSKTASTKSPKPEKSLVSEKYHASRQESTSQSCNLMRSTQLVSEKPIDRPKRSQPKASRAVRKTTATSSAIINTQHKEDEDRKETDTANDLHFISTTTSNLPADEIHPQTKQEDSEIRIAGKTENVPNSLCEIIPETNIQARSCDLSFVANRSEDVQNSLCETTSETNTNKRTFESAEAAIKLFDETTATGKSTENDLKLLLLSSPSFLSCAEELFDLNITPPMVCKISGVEEAEFASSRIILDCAYELLERKSCKMALASHPVLQTHGMGWKGNPSLDQLVHDLIDEIESLKCYSKPGHEGVHKDSLYVILERDLRCKSMIVNGVWDLGWTSRISTEAADHVAAEVEKHILSGLIEELITDSVQC